MSQKGIQILPIKDFPWWLVLLAFGIFCILVQKCHGQNSGWYGPLYEQNKVVQVAKSQLGVRERSGQNDGFDVEKYLATTGLGGGYAWCAAFVNWTMIHAGYDHPQNKAAWSPTWFPPERTYWLLGTIERYQPKPGDVFGIYFPSKKRIAHVGIITKWNGHYATTIEGNTNEAGSREGDGVYQKKRMKKQVYKVSNWSNER